MASGYRLFISLVKTLTRKQLENHLFVIEYPPFDADWVPVAIEAFKAVESGTPDKWIAIPPEDHEMTASDILEFMHIAQYRFV